MNTDIQLRWYQWRRKRHCPHVYVRGIYGDEINATPGFRRVQCLTCGRLLDGPVSIAVIRRRAVADGLNLTERPDMGGVQSETR